MDLMTLDANNQPLKMVENYDSLLWTERFYTCGDFELQTGDISRFWSLLPSQTRVTIRESNVPMIVEERKIERKKNQPDKLIIKGRSFESILDRRQAIQSLTPGLGDWAVNLRTPSDVAYYIMYYILTGSVDANDVFPGVTLPQPSDYNNSSGPVKTFIVPRGNLLAAVTQLLQTEGAADPTTVPATPALIPHGIRSVRPAEGGTNIAIQIYAGTDKSSTVYFDATRDLLDDGTYLFSEVNSGNVAYILGQSTSAKMNKGGSEPTGFARRVLLVDATGSNITDQTILRQIGSQSLSEAREVAMLDGSINQDISPYKYGVDYNLGDLVKLVGDYGVTQTSRVTEYIRSEGVDGTKSYPTLAALPIT